MSESGVPNGFHQIPGFPRYAIDENGIVISICPLTEERKRLSAELSQLVLDAVKIKDEWYPAQVQALRAKKLEQSVFSRGMNQIKDELRQRKLENLRKKREVEGKLSEVNSKLRVHGMKISADAAYRKSQKEAKPDVHLQCLQRIEALLIRIVDHMESRQ